MPERPVHGPGDSAELDSLLSSLPSLVAVPFREYFEETHPVEKLWCACHAAELLLRFSVFLGLADLRRRGAPPAEILAALERGLERPTLGIWEEMALLIASRAPRASALVPEISGFLREMLVPLLDGRDGRGVSAGSLKDLRNTLAHGGGMTRTVAGRQVPLWDGRIRQLLEGAAWLGGLDLVCRLPEGGHAALRGAPAQAVPFTPSNASLAASLAGTCGAAGDVVAVRGEEAVPLGPFVRYGIPESWDPGLGAPTTPVLQVYARRGDVGLHLTPVGSEEVCLSHVDGKALAELDALLLPAREKRKARERTFEVGGFDEEIRREASEFLERQEQVKRVIDAIDAGSGRVLWVTGEAGIGKSFLVSRVAADLLQREDRSARVLPYRFKAGDARCDRNRFFRYSIERLREWDGIAAGDRKKGRQEALAFEFEDLLRRLRPERRIVFLLDGMDEIAERDPRFAEEVPLRLQAEGVVWLCAGRGEHGLAETFREPRCLHVFPGGVPPMSEREVRTLLVENSERRRKRLIRNDREEGEDVRNRFVERVAALSKGLPLYVRHVITDIQSGSLSVLDDAEALTLPPSLEEYYEKLLTRYGIGIVPQVLTPLVSTLAVAFEPLDEASLADILLRGNVIPEEEDAQGLVHRILGLVLGMVRRAPRRDGREGFTLHHHSLREHFRQSPRTRATYLTARANLCRLAASPGPADAPAAPYLLHWGVQHLVEAGKRDAAIRLLTDFDGLAARLRALPRADEVRWVGEDWRTVRASGPLAGDAAVWEEFWRTREHLLLREGEGPPPHRVLFQLAEDHAAAGPVAAQARAWADAGRCDWPRFRLAPEDRPPAVLRDPCLFTLQGHRTWVNACAASADGRTAISAGGHKLYPDLDDRVRVWDLGTRELRRVLEGHKAPVRAVDLSPDGRIGASGGDDRTVRVWEIESGRCVSVLEGHARSVLGVSVSPDGRRLLSCSEDGAVWLWSVEEGRVIERLDAHPVPVGALSCTEDWSLAAWGTEDGLLKLRRPEGGGAPEVVRAHAAAVQALAFSAGGELVASGGQDGAICLWALPEARLACKWSVAPDAPAALAVLRDPFRVVAGCREGPGREDAGDTSLRLFEPGKEAPVKALKGTSDSITGLAPLPGGRTILSCGCDYTLKVWDLEIPAELLSRSQPWGFVNGLERVPGAGRFAAALDDGTVRVWDAATRRFARIYEAHDYVAWAATLTPDGSRVVSCSEDRSVRVRDAETAESVWDRRDHRDPVNSVTLSPDGCTAVSGAGNDEDAVDCTVGAWDLRTGRVLKTLGSHEKQIEQVKFLPDGRAVASSGWDGRVVLWEFPSGRVLWNFENAGLGVRALAISPDGRRCACGGIVGEARVWDLRAGTCVHEFRGHSDHVRRADVSADGRLLATVGDDCGLRLFDLRAMSPLATSFFQAWATAVAFIGDSYRCAVGLGDGNLVVVEPVGFPEPGVPVVTAVRIWKFPGPGNPGVGPQGEWDGDVTAACPRCGRRFAVPGPVLDCIRSVGRLLPHGRLPCLEYPDEAWAEAGLASACPLCGRTIQFNPFAVDGREERGPS
jgi:WD40 repeat protein